MENRHAVNIDTLPEEMMHRIQSFLSEKEAARTSTLSKSWYNAWLTRPHLDFDQQDFPVESVKFIDIVKKTLQRYKVNTIAGVVTHKDMLSLGPSVSPYEFQSLKCLQLEMVHINTLFFRDFSSKFPCLEDLIVRYCYGFKEIVVSSHSLECISFNLFGGILFRATFDVPSIRDFNFSGSCSSSLTIETVSKEWKCDISVSYSKHRTSWFTDLKKLLRNLSLSRICLCVHTWVDLSENRCDYASDDQGLPTPVVDDLMLKLMAAPLVPCAFLHVLFQSCHPKFLTLDLISFMTRKAVCDLVKLLRKTLMLEVSENVDSYVKGKWQPLPWKTLLDASTIPIEIEKLRFRLRWEQ